MASNDLASTFLSFCGSVPVRVVHVSHVLTHTRLVIFYPLLKVPSGQPIHVLPLTVLLLCWRSIVGLMHICFYLFSHRERDRNRRKNRPRAKARGQNGDRKIDRNRDRQKAQTTRARAKGVFKESDFVYIRRVNKRRKTAFDELNQV